MSISADVMGVFSKIFILKGLPGRYLCASPQNIESKGFICKILQNKELGAGESWSRIPRVKHRLGESARIGIACAF